MNVLDTSIANVSIPAIAGDLGVSPDQGTWVITSFAVSNAISVPVGLVAFGLSWVIYRERESPTRRTPIDGVGLALLVVWVGALQLMLDKGKDLDWFGSGQIVALAITSALGFCLFLVWELTEAH